MGNTGLLVAVVGDAAVHVANQTADQGKAQPLPKGALLINAALAKALAVKDGDTVITGVILPVTGKVGE